MAPLWKCLQLSVDLSISRAYQEELQALSGVQRELEITVREKSSLQMELSTLEGKYRVMETLRDSQQTELQSLKVGDRVKLGHVSGSTHTFSHTHTSAAPPGDAVGPGVDPKPCAGEPARRPGGEPLAPRARGAAEGRDPCWGNGTQAAAQHRSGAQGLLE